MRVEALYRMVRRGEEHCTAAGSSYYCQQACNNYCSPSCCCAAPLDSAVLKTVKGLDSIAVNRDVKTVVQKRASVADDLYLEVPEAGVFYLYNPEP